MNSFDAERQAFAQFKKAIEQDHVLRSDVEKALALVLTRFATSIRENRFVVGGAIEAILSVALRAAGIQAEDVGAEETRIDIRVPGGGFSVKGHFSGGDIRLINVLGKSSSTQWETATLFVLSGQGIAYGDPKLLGSAALKRESDAIVLRYSVLRHFLDTQPNYLIACDVPYALRKPASSELASRAIAREILASTMRLKEYIREGVTR